MNNPLCYIRTQRKHFIVYIYISKGDESFNMSKINYIIVMIHQFVAPKRKFMGEAKEVLTFNLFWLMILFSIVYESCRPWSSQFTTKRHPTYVSLFIWTQTLYLYVIDLIVDLDMNFVTDPSRIGMRGMC